MNTNVYASTIPPIGYHYNIIPFETYWSKSSRGMTLHHIRFGTALAKTRTKFQKKLRRKAYSFLRDALRNPGELNNGSRVNRAWIAGADLQPIVDYLASKWQCQGFSKFVIGSCLDYPHGQLTAAFGWEKNRCQNAWLLGPNRTNPSIQLQLFKHRVHPSLNSLLMLFGFIMFDCLWKYLIHLLSFTWEFVWLHHVWKYLVHLLLVLPGNFKSSLLMLFGFIMFDSGNT